MRVECPDVKKSRKPAPIPNTLPVTRPITHVVAVIDESGSMQSFRYQLLERVKTTVEHLKVRSHEQDIYFSLFTFSNPTNIRLVTDKLKITPELNYNYTEYFPNGNTALLDASHDAIVFCETIAKTNKEASFLLLIFTDGEENASTNTTAIRLMNGIKEVQATDRYTITFEVPYGQRDAVLRLGVHDGNINEWERTTVGFIRSTGIGGQSMSNYLDQRSIGTRSMTSYYSMTSDLSNLTPTDVKAQLDDLSNQYKVCQVEKEVDIKTFVEQKTKKPLVKGNVFYQLTKTEKIQRDKDILIMEKGKKAIWGGPQARKMLGLKDDQDARVKPGNHANWDIFCQSKADNRILVRGTSVLIKII